MISLEAIVSGMGYAVLALLLGLLVSAGFLLPGGEPKELRQTLLLAGAYLLVAFLVIAGFWLLLQGAKLRGGALPSGEILLRYIAMTQSGKVWVVREFYGAALAVIVFWFARSGASLKAIRFVFFLALPLVASRSFTSHAVAVKENTMVVVAADATHLIATGLWGWGLLHCSGFFIAAQKNRLFLCLGRQRRCDASLSSRLAASRFLFSPVSTRVGFRLAILRRFSELITVECWHSNW